MNKSVHASVGTTIAVSRNVSKTPTFKKLPVRMSNVNRGCALFTVWNF